ncbi:MAG: hypothetical protein WD670_08805 [Actinomycetota bacterium]
MEAAGDNQKTTASFNPILTEYFAEIARLTGLEPNDPHLDALRQAVQQNEELLALVDDGSRVPSEDPFDFIRFVRAWSESHGR